MLMNSEDAGRSCGIFRYILAAAPADAAAADAAAAAAAAAAAGAAGAAGAGVKGTSFFGGGNGLSQSQ